MAFKVICREDAGGDQYALTVHVVSVVAEAMLCDVDYQDQEYIALSNSQSRSVQ